MAKNNKIQPEFRLICGYNLIKQIFEEFFVFKYHSKNKNKYTKKEQT